METHLARKSVTASEPATPPAKCPLTAALNAIGGKWSLICLYWLDSGMRRFNELRRLMPDISHKVLTETLRSLESEGLISRTVYAEVPPRVSTASRITEKPFSLFSRLFEHGVTSILNGSAWKMRETTAEGTSIRSLLHNVFHLLL